MPPLALPPLEEGTLAGTLTGAELQRVGREGARTVPARENGGNHDIKNFTRGSRVYYPVHVPGAKLSGGDLHFSQGDGEITFCGAIEMGGFIDFGVDLIKDGMNKYGVTTNPVLIPGRVEPRYSEFLTFIGISVDESTGENYYLDATVAYRRACLNAIEYLKKFGYSGEQAYLLLGSAPIEGRISRRRRHPERVLLAVPADRDLRLRRAAEQATGRRWASAGRRRGPASAGVHLRVRGVRAVRPHPADGRGGHARHVPRVRRLGAAGVHPAGRARCWRGPCAERWISRSGARTSRPWRRPSEDDRCRTGAGRRRRGCCRIDAVRRAACC